jgi:hypothetical protein
MRALAIFVLFAFALGGEAFAAPKRQAAKPDQVRALYVAPKDTKYSAMYEAVREQRLLEQLAELLSPIRLPRPLTLKLEGCDGVANAYYEEDTVTICYEYLDFIVRSAPKGDAPSGTTAQSALAGPLVDVTLHEAGHAVFDMLQIPVLGREEDAADQFSAYIILNFAPRNARALIRSVAYLGAREAKEAMANSNDLKAFADSHGLPAQRYFNTLCIAYGSNQRIYADAITRGELTADRAEGCEYEYEMVERAFEKLIRPHIDQALLRKLRLKALFGLGDAGQKPAAPSGLSTQ